MLKFAVDLHSAMTTSDKATQLGTSKRQLNVKDGIEEEEENGKKSRLMSAKASAFSIDAIITEEKTSTVSSSSPSLNNYGLEISPLKGQERMVFKEKYFQSSKKKINDLPLHLDHQKVLVDPFSFSHSNNLTKTSPSTTNQLASPFLDDLNFPFSAFKRHSKKVKSEKFEKLSSNSSSIDSPPMPSSQHRSFSKDTEGRKRSLFRANQAMGDLSQAHCHLQTRELWEKFNELGTEMIITKSGRRMFPVIRISFTGLKPSMKYIVLMDIVPVDAKRYRYAYHRSSWLVAGKADPDVQQRCYVHPDAPFSGDQLAKQTISFEKLKLTNNVLDKHGYIILNSMHKYQPRIHLINRSAVEPFMATPPLSLSSLRPEEIKTFEFPETVFIAVTAYQNQLITKLKIDCNPFAKGFRDSSRLTEFERESMENLLLRHPGANGVIAALSNQFSLRDLSHEPETLPSPSPMFPPVNIMQQLAKFLSQLPPISEAARLNTSQFPIGNRLSSGKPMDLSSSPATSLSPSSAFSLHRQGNRTTDQMPLPPAAMLTYLQLAHNLQEGVSPFSPSFPFPQPPMKDDLARLVATTTQTVSK